VGKEPQSHGPPQPFLKGYAIKEKRGQLKKRRSRTPPPKTVLGRGVGRVRKNNVLKGNQGVWDSIIRRGESTEGTSEGHQIKVKLKRLKRWKKKMVDRELNITKGGGGNRGGERSCSMDQKLSEHS